MEDIGKPAGMASDDLCWPSPGKETMLVGKAPKSSQSKAGKQPHCAQCLSLAALGLPSSSMHLQLASLFLLDNFFLIRVFGRWPCSPEGEGEQFNTSNKLVRGSASSCCFQLRGWVGNRNAGGWLDVTEEARVIPCWCFATLNTVLQSRASA